MLFETLCPEEVRSLYDQSRREATNQGRGLRVKLRVLPPELAALPWEFIYDTRHQEFVALSRNTPMVRYLPSTSPLRPLHIEPPLRILAMAARPSDLTTLDVRWRSSACNEHWNSWTEQGLRQAGLAGGPDLA